MSRRPVVSVFVLAFAVRAVVATVVMVGWGGSLFLDDDSYSRLAELAANGDVLDDYRDFVYERTATLLVPVTAMYQVFGPIELFGQLYVALLGAATAAVTTRLAMEVVDGRWALLAGLIVALLPSQVLWSSLILKDAAVWAALSGLALVVALAPASATRRLALLGLTAAALLALLGFLRLHTLEIACVAILLAVVIRPGPRAVAPLTGAVALLIVVPLAFGMGVAGASFVKNSRDPAEQRALNAIDARSAVQESAASTSSSGDTSAGDASVNDTSSTDDRSSTDNSLRYLPTGLTVVALRPWPWERAGPSAGVRMARAETVVWYPLLALALVGLTTAWKNRRMLAFPIFTGGAILIMYGLTEGNLGTAYRHRGEVVWVVALLATLGAERIITWARKRQRQVMAT